MANPNPNPNPNTNTNQARELFLVAGDTHTHPITRLDGRVIGDGKVGPVCRALTAMLEEDAAADSADQHHPVCL